MQGCQPLCVHASTASMAAQSAAAEQSPVQLRPRLCTRVAPQSLQIFDPAPHGIAKHTCRAQFISHTTSESLAASKALAKALPC